MSALPVHNEPREGGCGTHCGEGLEKIYPTTAIRFGAMNWIGEFEYKPGTVFKCGGKVVVRTNRGTELGEQVSLSCNGCSHSVNREQIKRYIENSGPEFFRPESGRILREATAEDIQRSGELTAQRRADVDECALLAAQLALDMKVVTSERLLGGERMVYYFRADQRVDFRRLVRDLGRRHKTRIEMRQVGARDEARLVADYEICGRECCCKNFLKKLRPVAMKMAKLQKSTLDPSKVSGRCGRLRCCLRYEHESYEELARRLPRVGMRLDTEYGPATVRDRQILTQLLLVRTDDEREITIPLEETRPLDRDEKQASAEAESEPQAKPRRRSAQTEPAARRTSKTDENDPAGRTHGPQSPSADRADAHGSGGQTTDKADDQPRGNRRRRGRRRRGRGRGRGRPDSPNG
jgi:cell fate regulator YaaT (PSP1 superfamily)